MSEQMYFNGIDGASGSYLLPPMPPEKLSAIIQHQPVDTQYMQELQSWIEQRRTAHYAVEESVDPKNLAETGWGVIFAHDANPAIIEALKPLLDHRQRQAAAVKENRFQKYTVGAGYRPGDSKNDWLKRHGSGPGPVDPDKVPYYLLLVGDPEKIPYRFQSQLDVQHGVGRICFDTVEEYASYAQSVVEAETQKLKLARRNAFFGVSNADDPATQLSADQLIAPLVESMRSESESLNTGWQFDLILKDNAKKSALAEYLGGAKTPALFFAASHGMSFPSGDLRQFRHQGSLLCQDWPGPRQWKQPVPEEFYFSADDLSSDAKLWGSIAFFFACYGGGTPKLDDFTQQAFKDQRAEFAPRPFIARLPQRMLSHPKGGALAVIGHVDRAWGYSFVWGKAGKQLAVFESSLKRLMDGNPIGHAFEYFNERYAELSSDLTVELEEIQFGKKADNVEIAGMWTANNDARDYVILGDPAVRMMVAETGDVVAVERSMITISSGASGAPAQQPPEPPVEPPVPSPASSAGNEGAPVSYGLFDSTKEALGNVGNSLQQLAQKLGDVLLAAIQDVSTLKVSTYVSDNLEQVKLEEGKVADLKLTGARLRALTYIKVDGDTLICVPEEDGEVDTRLWDIHMEMVKQAQQSRSELIKTVVEAASSLATPGGPK